MSAMTDLLRVTGPDFELASVDPRSTPGFDGEKADGHERLARQADELATLQEQLYAASTAGSQRSVLLIVQAMDTAGKGGIMRHVVGQVDPQGVHIHAFKKPTPDELRHDFLWRIENQVPKPGQIGVFDRSHYEDVLIHRVHGWADAAELERRYRAIRDWEVSLLARQITPIKVMLHISFEEQGERLLERLDRDDKHWKFNPGDIDERALWPAYMEAYETAIRETATPECPWYVIPADRKWYSRVAVQELLLETLRGLGLEWPAADFDVAAERERLLAQGESAA